MLRTPSAPPEPENGACERRLSCLRRHAVVLTFSYFQSLPASSRHAVWWTIFDTYSHPNLARLSAVDAETELRRSRDLIADQLGARSICSPTRSGSRECISRPLRLQWPEPQAIASQRL
jgi:hypothetical protein